MVWCILGGMKTEIIRVDPSNIDPYKVRTAAEVVDGGGLAAFPTETVYGIACRVDKSALDRLDEAKGRPADKRYTLHIGGLESRCDFFTPIPLRAGKLINKFWPGPLTVVFELSEEDLTVQKEHLNPEVYEILYEGGTVGVRCPDNPVAIALLNECKWPVVAPSANKSGSKPALTAEKVVEQLDDSVDIVIAPENESDVCGYQINSTVVKISSLGVEILREGAVKKEDIEEYSKIQILFVCTGNTCRSPMGEFFCKKYIAEKLNCDIDELENKGYKVVSVGVYAAEGMPVSGEVVDICREKGIDASGHVSRSLTTQEIEKSDIIFAMTESHRHGVLEICPAAAEKSVLLNGDDDIPDPIGSGISVYRECASVIEQAIRTRFSEMNL